MSSLEDAVNFLEGEEARHLVWGVVLRGVAITYLIGYAAFVPQITDIATSRGFFPIAPQLDRTRKDISSPLQRLLVNPTLFAFVTPPDWVIQAMPILGVVLSILAFFGGEHSPALFIALWVLYRHVDITSGLVYPWDCLLLETGFLVCWFPPLASAWPVLERIAAGGLQAAASPDLTDAVGTWGISELPYPILAWAVRWLLFRVLVGFGKLKFSTPSHYWTDRLYIKHFYIYMPMTTYLGWLGNKLPDWFHVLSIVIMFVSELVTPFFYFFTGWPRLVASFATILLMVGIQATGNFGYFNILTSFLSLSLLDVQSSLWEQAVPPIVPDALFTPEAWSSAVQTWVSAASSLQSTGLGAAWDVMRGPLGSAEMVVLGIIVLLILPTSAFLFPLNSWITGGGFYWGALERAKPAWLISSLLHVFRVVLPTRIVHAYGVFPPHTSPPCRWAAVFEGSNDGETWVKYRYKYYITDERSPPVFVAPWHPRLDHGIFYDSLAGMNGHNLISALGSGMPYMGCTNSSQFQRLQVALLEGKCTSLFAENPFPDAPPRFVRASCYFFRPASISHWWATGEWWHARRSGTHMPPIERDSVEHKVIWESYMRPPEVWQAEAVVWKRWTGLTEKPLSAEDVDAAFALVGAVRRAAAESRSFVRPPRGASSSRRPGDAPQREDAIKVPAAEAAKYKDGDALLDQTVATRVFTWRILRQVWGTVVGDRFGYDALTLLDAEESFGRVATPLTARLMQIFHRATPEDAVLEREVVALRALMERVASGEAETPFAGFDAVEANAEEWEEWESEYMQTRRWMEAEDLGLMADPFRVGRFAHWIVLVGGRDLYEHIMGLEDADFAGVLGRRLGLLTEGEAEPNASKFLRLIRPSLHPRWMSDENGVFLESLFRYDVAAHMAQHGGLMEKNSRAEATHGGTVIGPPVPGWVHMLGGLGRQRQLRLWNAVDGEWCHVLEQPTWAETDDANWDLVDDGTADGDAIREASASGDIPSLPEDDRLGPSMPPPRVYGVPSMGPADGHVFQFRPAAAGRNEDAFLAAAAAEGIDLSD